MKKVLKSKLTAGILILIVVCLGIVFAGDVIVKEGLVEGENVYATETVEGVKFKSTGCTATGTKAVAFGTLTEASAPYSTAVGYDTTAGGTGVSTAMGCYTEANGAVSTAMGYDTTASGDYSTAMGRSTDAIEDYSTAMGYNTTASGAYSTAMGYDTTASGGSSTAMGQDTTRWSQQHSHGSVNRGIWGCQYGDGMLDVCNRRLQHSDGNGHNSRTSDSDYCNRKEFH